MDRRRLVLIALAATAALVLSGQAAAATCAPWRNVPIPGGAGAAGAGMLWGVASHSAGNAMAVGDGGQHAIALRWRTDGPWRTVNVPERGQESELSDITRIPGTNDYWSVGSKTSAGETRSHIVRWTGTEWIVVPSPSVPGAVTTLRGVTALSATNAWAVGSHMSLSPFSSHTFVLRWNGTRWRIVDSPSPVPSYASGDVPDDHLNDILAISSGTVWTVGDMSYGEADDDRWPLVLRRQAGEWRSFPLAQRGFIDTLESTSALSPRDIWTVGWSRNPGFGIEPLAFHWNGQSWTEAPLPPQHEEDAIFLQGVQSLSPSKTWAVGWDGTSIDRSKVVVFGWNGTSWKAVDNVEAPQNSRLLDVTRVPNTEITWAVGGVPNFLNGGGTPVIYRHC